MPREKGTISAGRWYAQVKPPENNSEKKEGRKFAFSLGVQSCAKKLVPAEWDNFVNGHKGADQTNSPFVALANSSPWLSQVRFHSTHLWDLGLQKCSFPSSQRICWVLSPHAPNERGHERADKSISTSIKIISFLSSLAGTNLILNQPPYPHTSWENTSARKNIKSLHCWGVCARESLRPQRATPSHTAGKGQVKTSPWVSVWFSLIFPNM